MPSLPLGPALAVTRGTALASRLTRRGGGTTLPGKVLSRLAPAAPSRLAARLPRGVACVSATNGKTTTCAMIAEIVSPQLRLVRNGSGANLASGIAAALATRAAGRADLALFECDEAALPGVVRDLSPHTIALGNLFRDQLDRYGELETLAARWRTLVAELPLETMLVVCADDPVAADLADGRRRAIRYGIDDETVALDSMQHAADSRFCVRCGAPYRYAAIYLGHLGDFHCPSCGHARPPLDVLAHEIDFDGVDGVRFTLATATEQMPVALKVPGLYNVENALAAAGVCLSLGFSLATIASGLNRFAGAFGRAQRVSVGGREAVMLLIKNPAGANEVLRTLPSQGVVAQICLNDRIADGRDVSWIWDVDWERTADSISHVVCSGNRALDMALRLKYAGLELDRIEVVDDCEAGLDRALERAPAGARVMLLPTYTAMLELQGVFAARGLVAPYWEQSR